LPLKFKQESKNVYLDAASDVNIDTSFKYRLILSPHLYWVKKVSLPLKHVRDVKKLAHTLFEESIPEDVHYSYYVYKKGEDFFVFAYDDKKILALIQEKKIPPQVIASIHFAQSELDSLEDVYHVNETEVLKVKDGVVVLLPSAWFESSEELDVESLKLSNKSIKLQQFNQFVESKVLYKVIAVLSALVLIFGAEAWFYMQERAKISDARAKVFSEYGLQPTMMQNRSILQHYETIDKQQRALRENIVQLLQASLRKAQKIQSISYTNGKLKAVISNVNKGEEKRILAPFFKKKTPYEVSFNNGNLEVEIAL